MPIQVGGNVQPTGQVDQLRTFALAFTGGAGSSGVFASMANPEGQTFIVTHATLRITTQSTGASTLDIGIAADATTSNDGIIDGLTRQISGSVRWMENMAALSERAEVIYEVGPNKPLARFFKEQGRDVQSIINVRSAEKIFGGKAS